ncbi:MAG TPA: glycosyltransferase [Candidatus Saccharimonadales bacterium]|nr:glycosyltransferase [Candidatus Saccharimonadales bacterium]
MNEPLHSFLNSVLPYVPLTVIGVWRWSMWAARKIAARLFYRPLRAPWPADQPKPRVSVVTPVYNEDPDIFDQAVQSWIANGVAEVIAVIDYSNTRQIISFQRDFGSRRDVSCRAIVTRKPGKRAALADGCAQASGEIIALVDSDTIWGDKVMTAVLPYFGQTEIGGVTTQQRVLGPKTVAEVLFDIVLWDRYHEEVPFLLAAGKVVNTLSGRTAFYRREALLNPRHDNLHLLTHEFYWRSRCISGDDKRLTHLVLEQGWHLGYAPDAVVYTPGMPKLKTYLKQRVRWTRNSWRADTRAFKRTWVLRHPALAIYNLDRFVQPFFMLIGPIALVIALTRGAWPVVLALVIWWLVTRFIRLFGYFRAYPARLRYLPAYIVFSYVNALVKIYAWATILEQGWITRWDKKRLARKRTRSLLQGSALTLAAVAGMFVAVEQLLVKAEVVTEVAGPTDPLPISLPVIPSGQPAPPPGAATARPVRSYQVVPGDRLTDVAARLGVPIDELRRINSIPNRNRIDAGQVLYYFGSVR